MKKIKGKKDNIKNKAAVELGKQSWKKRAEKFGLSAEEYMKKVRRGEKIRK